MQRADSRDSGVSEATTSHLLVLTGAFAANVASFGWVMSSGFFFDYYRSHIFVDQSTFAISWLSSLGFCCLYLASLPLALFCSSSTFGPRRTLLVGAIIDALALVTLPLASSLGEVLALQAFLGPL